MRYKILRITFLILVLILIKTTPAPALLYIGSSGSLSGSASFLIDGGGNLQVILTNTSSADVSNPSQVLTALFLTSSE